jgi:hypothetical protein
MAHLVIRKHGAFALMAGLLAGACGTDDVSGNWCGKEVDTPAACEREGQGNDMWYAELSQADEAVTGFLCEDGYAACSGGQDQLAITDGKMDGDTLSFTLVGRTMEMTLDGDKLEGVLPGCSTCDGQPCMCDLPLVLYRIE